MSKRGLEQAAVDAVGEPPLVRPRCSAGLVLPGVPDAATDFADLFADLELPAPDHEKERRNRVESLLFNALEACEAFWRASMCEPGAPPPGVIPVARVCHDFMSKAHVWFEKELETPSLVPKQ